MLKNINPDNDKKLHVSTLGFVSDGVEWFMVNGLSLCGMESISPFASAASTTHGRNTQERKRNIELLLVSC